MKLKIDNKGVSLALTIGLLLLLVTITTAVNELVIRALRASHQIEASDKAYFAAEGGIEDALYELSAHSAGYETGTAREDDFTETVTWNNEWSIENRGLNDCSLLDSWENPYIPNYCGRIYEGGKLVINLFTDDAADVGIDTNQINETAANIRTLVINSITVKFRLPVTVVSENAAAFPDLSPLSIDNDGDYDTGSGVGLNEDGPEPFFAKNLCAYSGALQIDDNDCDAKEDEDSEHDPVILWKLIDDQGNSFQPLRGCKTDPQHASHPNAGENNASLCEKDFVKVIDELSVTLTQADMGVDQNGTITDLATFMGDAPVGSQLQMEFLVVAPLQAVDTGNFKKIPIPYLEYGIEYNAGGDLLPSTYFSIKSDGYFRDFKQSITTNVVPRATTRLLDLTIIQQ